MNKLKDYYQEHGFFDDDFGKNMTSEQRKQFFRGVHRMKKLAEKSSDENIRQQIDQEYIQRVLDRAPIRKHNKTEPTPPPPRRTLSHRNQNINWEKFVESHRGSASENSILRSVFGNSSSDGASANSSSRSASANSSSRSASANSSSRSASVNSSSRSASVKSPGRSASANSSSRGGLHKYKSRHTKRRYRKTQKRHK